MPSNTDKATLEVMHEPKHNTYLYYRRVNLFGGLLVLAISVIIFILVSIEGAWIKRDGVKYIEDDYPFKQIEPNNHTEVIAETDKDQTTMDYLDKHDHSTYSLIAHILTWASAFGAIGIGTIIYGVCGYRKLYRETKQKVLTEVSVAAQQAKSE